MHDLPHAVLLAIAGGEHLGHRRPDWAGLIYFETIGLWDLPKASMPGTRADRSWGASGRRW